MQLLHTLDPAPHFRLVSGDNTRGRRPRSPVVYGVWRTNTPVAGRAGRENRSVSRGYMVRNGLVMVWVCECESIVSRGRDGTSRHAWACGDFISQLVSGRVSRGPRLIRAGGAASQNAALTARLQDRVINGRHAAEAN